MPGIHILRGKLKSIESIRSFTGAIRSVSNAKYARLSAMRKQFKEYADECENTLKLCGMSFVPPAEAKKRTVYVVFTGNKGFCADYNTSLLKYFMQCLNKDDVFYTCGEWAASQLKGFEERRIGSFKRSDIPLSAESSAMARELIRIYKNGEAEKIVFVYQKFGNMLLQTPTEKQIFPADTTERSESSCIFVPDESTVSREVSEKCIEAECHSIMLEVALGAQAATAMAMRNAYDNACDMHDRLLLQINRKRQSIVTSDVIETSSRAKEDV